MKQRAYHFDAFISYRHLDRDKKIVDMLQKRTENFRSPCDGIYIQRGEKIQRLFTDRSELPLSADLGGSITQALEQSRFLVVIASPEYLQSRWCMEELRFFLQHNQNSTERILFVQVGGSPSCVTDILKAAGVAVDAAGFQEPLYINACAPSVTESIKIVKREHLRLAAVLIGCSYDSLYQRHKRAAVRKFLAASALTLLIGAAVGTALGIQNHRRKQEADYRAMDNAIARIDTLLHAENRTDALDAMQALYRQYEYQQAYTDYLAQELEAAAIKASYVPAFSAFARNPLPFEQTGISVSDDGNYVIAFDVDALREEGKLQIFLYDAYLNKLSEHTLPVEEWKSDLLLYHLFDSLRISYEDDQQMFIVEHLEDDSVTGEDILGRRLAFSREGQLLSNQELTADAVGRASPELRALYNTFSSVYPGPVCMSADCLYAIATAGDSGYEPIGPKGEIFGLVSISLPSNTETIAYPERFSDNHIIDSISITPDDRFVLVKEVQGVYHDVVTVCDTSGQWQPVTLDMGGHWIQDMVYQFDEETRNAYFLFHLSVAGEDNSSVIAQFRIASGELQNCELYECKYAYACLLSSQDYIYILDDAEIIAITARNLCLPDAMAGIERNLSFHADASQNDLIQEANPHTAQSIDIGNLIITSDVSRTNHITPAFSTGIDIGVGIYDNSRNPLVRFYSDGFQIAYFNKEDRVFGLVDSASPEYSQLFYLYGFNDLMTLDK